MKAAGAVSLIAHTEGWTADELASLPLDGFEMYNVHANLIVNLGVAAELVEQLSEGKTGLPDPNLFLLTFQIEDDRYISTWGSVLARGARRVTTMGTDCHRNALPQLAQDGERVDSYRRMMAMFTNHLLVRPNASGG